MARSTCEQSAEPPLGKHTAGMEENNRRIVKNSIWMYVRMLFIMAISLYTSRVVLDLLGVSDFGIYSLVAGIVSIFTVISGTLNSSVQRFINIGIGKGERELTRAYFSQSLTLYLIALGGFLLISQTLGLWVVKEVLNIPAGRETAALWVYESAIVALLFAVVQIPFSGAVIAHEKMNIFAFCGIFDVSARLVVVIALSRWGSADNLITYSLLICAIQVCIALFYIGYSLCKFDECRLRLCWRPALVREILSFISYSLFGNTALTLAQQGINVIINLFFGTAVNAARGIATQVSVAVIRLEECINTPVKPQIVQAYASGERERMLFLFEKNAKYTLFAMLLLCTPLICETRFVLDLWLPFTPDFAVAFTRIVLVESVVAVMAYSAANVITAVGKLRNLEFWGRLITLSALPLSLVALKLFKSGSWLPLLPAYISLAAQCAYTLYVMADLRRRVNPDMGSYWKNVLRPALAALIMLAICILPQMLLLPDALLRFFTVGLTTLAIMLFMLRGEVLYLLKRGRL